MATTTSRGRRSKVRLTDIASEAGLSVSTVSMALSDHPGISRQTRMRVRRLSRLLGYDKPGQSRPRIADKRIGYVLIGSRFDDEAVAPSLQAISERARAAEARIETTTLEDDDPAALRTALMEFVADLDGLLISGMITQDLLAALRETQVACVILGHIVADEGYRPPLYGHLVSGDEVRMGQMATSALIATGHTRIGFVCETMPRGLYMSRWCNGYRLVHFDHGIALDPDYTQITGKSFAGGDAAAEAYSQMKDPPTAFVVPDVRIGASFVRAMKRRGLPVARDQIILGGHNNLRPRYELEGYPIIYCDMVRQAETAFEMVSRDLSEGLRTDLNVVIEPDTLDMPGGDARRVASRL